MSRLTDKTVLLCVGGGIAAYKSAEIVRRLREVGSNVQVAMTAASAEFIGPLTLQALSGQPVASKILDAREDSSIGHIVIAERADAVLVAPATAGLISRLAVGAADDMVTAAVLAARCPIIVAPAMNTHMFEHPAVQANLKTLESFGYRIVQPDHGKLACGYEGVGRLPDADVLVDEIECGLATQDLAGARILVSAGPTREAIDSVRYISNRSSGRMGYAVAAEAYRRGGRVTLITGPTALVPPRGCETIQVSSAAEMGKSVRAAVATAEVLVMVAAVADYRPSSVKQGKIKKSEQALHLELEATEDILSEVSKARGDRIVVGFAAETERVREYAREKLERKGLDLIVANDVSGSRSGFDVEHNSAWILGQDGFELQTGLVTKRDLAERIWDRVAVLRQSAGRLSRRRVGVSDKS